MHAQPNITITSEDASRLADILSDVASAHAAVADQLDSELARATIVPAAALPAGVVAMNSRVLFEDVATGQRREVTLVYPEHADVSAGRVSVLTSTGSALLGLSVGQEAACPAPRGRERRIRVLAVTGPGQETAPAS